jgi:hypothetical protein
MAEPNKIKETSPATTTLSPDVAALMAKVADLTSQVVNLQRTIAVERPVTLPLKLQQEREEEYERFKAELSKPCQQRTQEEAERLWARDTTARYRVKVADQLELLIPARSPEEAQGRYNKISGIINVDTDKHKYRIELVSNAA